MGTMSGPVLPSDGFKPGSATLEAPRSPLPTALPAGTLLRNRYRLTGTLKIGRVAAVYRAEEAETGRPVTVQIFHELGRNDRDRIASYRRPRSSRVARPDLPGAFVTVHACDLTDEGQLFLVTEAVQGASLADILARTPKLAPARALELATRIGEALEAALNIGLLELPLAPADIIVDDADRVKLLRSDVLVLRQLGLAEQLAAAEATERDPRYVSPEELAGLPATERSVVYRFGVLLYELLCGEVPFDGTKSDDVHDRQLRSPPRRLRDRHPTLPASLDRLASRMLDPEPMARPADPTSILNELWEAACRFRTEAPPAPTDAASPSRDGPNAGPTFLDATLGARRPPHRRHRWRNSDLVDPGPESEPGASHPGSGPFGGRRAPPPGPGGDKPAARRAPAPGPGGDKPAAGSAAAEPRYTERT